MNFRLAIFGKPKIRVVALLADAGDRTALHSLAARENWKLQFAGTRGSVLEDLRRNPAVVLCDDNWRETVDELKAGSPRSRVILAAAATDDKLWQDVLERGGYDVVTRPFHGKRLIESVAQAWREVMK